MGLVHFLHGNPKKPKVKQGNSVRCPNDKCKKKISKVQTLNGKKVCPHCKTVIPAKLVKILEKKVVAKAKQK